MKLISGMFDMATVLYYGAFCLLAIHWLASLVTYATEVYCAARLGSIGGFRGGDWSTSWRPNQVKKPARQKLPRRLPTKWGAAGAILLGISGVLFLLGAIGGLIV
jgi:hypothetical protein